MSIKNVYKSWKSTLVGTILFLSGIAYVAFSLVNNVSPDYIIMSILLAIGILLIFSPDLLINKLQEFIGKKSKEI
jgi:uncharacterized membrane protein HdeD (DUF308 family)